jgi:hypothetical protein
MNKNIKTDSGIAEILKTAEENEKKAAKRQAEEEMYPQDTRSIDQRYREALRIHRPKNN